MEPNSLTKKMKVIQNVCRGGKSNEVMGEVHELIVAGRASEILLVFSDKQQAYQWVREWQDVFPFVPAPDYVTINNMLNVRGKQVSRVFIENVEMYENGIYEEKLEWLWPCLRSPLNDEQIVFTSSPLELNQRSHSATVKVADVVARYKKRLGLWTKNV